MGLAIVNINANYTLQRIAQNVIPLDSTKRIPLTSISSFNYNDTPEVDSQGNLIYRLQSLNLGIATQPYIYSIENDPAGANVDPISGVVTITSEFTGTWLRVILSAVYDETYYTKAASDTGFKAYAIINNISAPSSYNDLTITHFSYTNSTINANGGTITNPRVDYQYTKEGVPVATGGTITYKLHSISDSGATVGVNTGNVTIDANDSSSPKVFIIEAKVTVDGTSQTEVTRITQAASSTPSEETDTYEFSNVSLTYSESPVAATGNSIGITPTLNYTLTKVGSSESVSAQVVYSVQGTTPTGVVLTASNGKVTFPANGTDDLVSVTIKATLTAPDGTTATPTATITQNTRTLTGISFKSYNGASAINITTGTTINKSEISVNLIYDAGTNGTGTCTSIAVGGMTGSQESSHQFTKAGNYPMRIYHNNFYVDVQVVVTAVTKAYITETLPEAPYSTGFTTSNNGSSLSIPLSINVVTPSSSVQTTMLFKDFLTATNLGEKETYGNPQITFSSNAIYNNMPNLDNGSGVGSDGTLTFDLTKPNYVYDKTKITGISIPCTSGGTSINATLDYSVGAQKLDTTYFQNMTSVKLNDLTSDQLSNLNITKYTGKKVSTSSLYSQYPNQLYIEAGDSSNIYYQLPYNANGYIISVVGGANVGIISDTSLGNLYTIDQGDVKGFETSSSNILYVKHTPSSGKSTFLIKTNSGNADWYILTPNS